MGLKEDFAELNAEFGSDIQPTTVEQTLPQLHHLRMKANSNKQKIILKRCEDAIKAAHHYNDKLIITKNTRGSAPIWKYMDRVGYTNNGFVDFHTVNHLVGGWKRQFEKDDPRASVDAEAWDIANISFHLLCASRNDFFNCLDEKGQMLSEILRFIADSTQELRTTAPADMVKVLVGLEIQAGMAGDPQRVDEIHAHIGKIRDTFPGTLWNASDDDTSSKAHKKEEEPKPKKESTMDDAPKTEKASESTTSDKATAPLPAAAAPTECPIFTKKNMLLVGGGMLVGGAVGYLVGRMLWK